MLQPLSAAKWNPTTAAHLLNRAGFGGTPAEIQHLVELGPERAVALFVEFDKIPDPAPAPAWAKPDPQRAEKLQAFRRASPEERKQLRQEEQRTQRERMLELRGWWLQRMARGPRPLQEKLTLFWHGHFATSIQKVRDTYLMWRQNETLRRFGAGRWLELVTAVAKDPAMLIWLDQAQSRQEHPNENFAREVMELFVLGEGHYTERDVAEAARALTGWSLNRVRQEFEYRSALHDPGGKTVLGRTGNLTGADVLAQIVGQPQAARFIAAKLWTFFASENPSNELVGALAAEFQRGGGFFKPLLRKIFLSEEFYAEPVVRQQIKSPVQLLVGSVRMLECELPPPLVANNALRLLGQELFAPPNVKGWDGGRSWITTNNLLNRYNLAGLLVLGENSLPLVPNKPAAPGREALARRLLRERMGAVDFARIVPAAERQDSSRLLAALEQRFLQARLREQQAATLREFLAAQGQPDDADVGHAIRLLMSTPDFQLT